MAAHYEIALMPIDGEQPQLIEAQDIRISDGYITIVHATEPSMSAIVNEGLYIPWHRISQINKTRS